jgi:hypothetical protein
MAPAQPLTTEQCEILGVLVDPDATAPDRTVGMLAKRVGMGPREVATRLKELEGRSPPLVRLVEDETWEVQAWLATDEGRRARESCAG